MPLLQFISWGRISSFVYERVLVVPIVPCIFYMFANKLLFCLGMIGWFSRLQANGLADK